MAARVSPEKTAFLGRKVRMRSFSASLEGSDLALTSKVAFLATSDRYTKLSESIAEDLLVALRWTWGSPSPWISSRYPPGSHNQGMCSLHH